MPIIHYPGYITKEEFARMFKIQVRTVNDWIRKTSPAPGHFSYIKVDGHVCVRNPVYLGTYPAGLALNELEWVRNFAKRHKMFFERVYEAIVRDEINGVSLCGRVYIINTEPRLLEYVANYKRMRKVGVPFYIKYPSKPQ